MAARPKKEVTAERDRQIWYLRTVKYRTLQQIADEFGMDQSCVSRSLARTEARLSKTFEADIALIRHEHTAKLNDLAEEIYFELQRSKQDAEKEKTVTKVGAPKQKRDPNTGELLDEEPAEDVAELVTEKNGRLLDANLSREYRSALQDIRTMWGADAPKKTDLTSGGQPVKAYIGVDLDEV